MCVCECKLQIVPLEQPRPRRYIPEQRNPRHGFQHIIYPQRRVQSLGGSASGLTHQSFCTRRPSTDPTNFYFIPPP